MTTCATCARALRPDWKFCIYCGTPTGFPAVETEPEPQAQPQPEPEGEPASEQLDEVELVDYDAEIDDLRSVDGPEAFEADDADSDPDAAAEPEPAAVPSTIAQPLRSRPLPTPVDITAVVDDDEPIDLPDDETPRTSLAALPALADEDAPESRTDGPSAPEPEPASPAETVPPMALDPDDVEPRDRAGAVNVLAMIALALAILLSPLAALFGHLALNQLRTSGERGVIPAWIALVLGYLWLGAAIVLGITYLATNV